MAYAPPPGTNSLPARPPPAFSSSSSSAASPASSSSNNNSNTIRHGFRPAFASAQTYQAHPSYPPGATNYGANNYSSQNHYASRPQYGASSQYGSTASYSTSSSYGSAPGVNSSTGYGYASQQPQQQSMHQPHQQQQQQRQPSHQAYGSQNASNYASSSASTSNSYAPPQIQNPFPAPGTAAASAYDATEAAQIAEWQSAYSAPPQTTTGRDGKPLALVSEPSKPEPSAVAAAAAATNPDKKKTVVRQGGGKKWTDDTLLEWDPSHLRLFVGNLAGETTDESLLKAFARWKSVQKARVIRDKRTTKSKGYGFVSFSNADDFFQAAKEMNGKYIQSHPVVVRKANTEIKVSNVKDKTKSNAGKQNNKNKNKNKNGHHGHAVAGGYEPSLGPVPGAGITKPGQKTKNGLRLLG
ncbi:hypothetical protein CP533_4120 [Ophiocordyceps camponoti-saundersi (nom. inval.)]|nr:hypothetical protein CP533_4120 [Ophiocordyceps camponoti-saundersi (nom. inval.)]